MLLKNLVDLNQVRFLELARRQVSADSTPHPVGVSPRPVRKLFLASKRQRNLVESEVRPAMVAKWKHRDFLRSCLIVVGGDLGLDAARIEFDQMIKPVFFAVSFQTVLVAEKWSVRAVGLSGASTQSA